MGLHLTAYEKSPFWIAGIISGKSGIGKFFSWLLMCIYIPGDSRRKVALDSLASFFRKFDYSTVEDIIIAAEWNMKPKATIQELRKRSINFFSEEVIIFSEPTRFDS